MSGGDASAGGFSAPASVAGEAGSRTPVAKLSTLAMTGMVVGSMVGAGVFTLPGRFARETGVAGALIAWSIAGAGMLMLAFVFQLLAVRKPELDAGVYAYAKEGFGEYLGFFSGFGYWASACAGNTFYWVFIMSTLTGLGSADSERETPPSPSLCPPSASGGSSSWSGAASKAPPPSTRSSRSRRSCRS